MNKPERTWTYEFLEDDFVDAIEGMRPFADLYWFAKDIQGAFGVFCSAGFGPIPLAAMDHFDSHLKASVALLEGSYISNFSYVMQQSGLYVFDYEEQGQYRKNRPYIRTGIPTVQKRQLESNYSKELRQCAVHLDVDFEDSKEVVVEQLQLDINVE